MGTWGPAIFSDDVACDVRDNFREMVGQGLDPEGATRAILQEMPADEDDPAEVAVFWMALAACQWRCGRLVDSVRDRALEVIDSGADLDVWEQEAPKLVKKRQAAIQKLREQLLSPQRPPTRISRVYVNDVGWNRGDAIAFQLKSGDFSIWRVLGIYKRGLSRLPILEVADCCGRQIPDRATIQTAERRRTNGYQKELKLGVEFDYEDHVRATDGQFMFQAGAEPEIPFGRLRRVATDLRTTTATEDGTFLLLWSDVDKEMANLFSLR